MKIIELGKKFETKEDLVNWLREEQKVHIAIDREYDQWSDSIVEFSEGNKIFAGKSLKNTWQEALDAAIVVAVEFEDVATRNGGQRKIQWKQEG